MWMLDSPKKPNPFVVELELHGKPIKMELDTGASVSIIGTTLPQEFPNLPCEPLKVRLRSYTKDLKPVVGKVTVTAKFKKHHFELPAYRTTHLAPYK